MNGSMIEIAGDVLACLGHLVNRTADRGGQVVFLARDGWLPWQLSNEVGPYLMVSRQALRIPLFAADPERAVKWAVDPVTVNTVKSVLTRFLACPESFERELRVAGFEAHTWDSPFNRRDKFHFKNFLLSSAFKSHLDFLRDVHLGPTMDYLNSHGLFANELHIVDVGWNGSCHKHLQEYRLMAGVDPASLGGIYLGLQTRSGFAHGTGLEAVWEPGSVGSRLFQLSSFYTLAEMILTADHPGVTGYEQRNGEAIPLLANDECMASLVEWGLPQFHRDVLQRARFRMSDAASDFTLFATQTALAFERFALQPSVVEAEKYGEWPSCVDPAHQLACALAPEMSFMDMWNYFVHRKPQPILWREGVSARLSGLHRLVFLAANWLDLVAADIRRAASRMRTGTSQ